MVGFGVTRVHLFFKITNVGVCQVADQAKIVSTLVQKRLLQKRGDGFKEHKK